jgi:hypothetical protein
MASEYRRRLGGDTWHFCSTCSQWPTDDFVSSEQLPRSYQICNECVAKNQHGACEELGGSLAGHPPLEQPK